MGSPLNETFKDVLKYMPSRIVPSLAAFVGVMFFTRLLSPEEYGLYILVMATVSFASIPFGWLNQSSLRYFAAFKSKNFQKFLSTSILSLVTLLLIIPTLWYISTIILDDLLDSRLIYLLRVATLVLAVQVGFNLTQTLLRADRKSLKYSLYSSLNAVIRVSLAVSLLYFLSFGPEGILWATAASMGVIFLWELVQIYRKWGIKISSFSRKMLVRFASYGFPLIGTTVGGLILSTSDRYMIQYLVGTESVGIYASGYKISSMSIQLFSVLILASFPIIISTFENEGEEKAAHFLNDLVSLYLVILTPVVFGITALSKDIVTLFLGKAFHHAYIVLPWASAGAFCLGLGAYFNKPFELKEKTSFLLYCLIFSAILNICLNLYLIPRFGIFGAAFATLVSYLAYLVITRIVSRRFFTWEFPWITCGKSLTAAVGMYILLGLIPNNFTNGVIMLLVKILLGSFTYFGILFLLKEEKSFKAFRYLTSYFGKSNIPENNFTDRSIS